MYAAVRIRGSVNSTKQIEDTLKMLRLTRKNHCVIVPKNETFTGMLKKAQAFITWGEIDKETFEKLIAKRGRLPGDKRLDEKKAKEISEKSLKSKKIDSDEMKKVFRLTPPSKGFKATRLPFPKGELGYRGEKINDLLKRMI